MEYEIDNKTKYTTLHIRTTLVCKKKRKEKQKGNTDTNPPRGDGE